MRIASTGDTRVARDAGRSVASAATARSASDTPPKVGRSQAATPNRSDDIERAKFYSEDGDYLIEREQTVTHHEVTVHQLPDPN